MTDVDPVFEPLEQMPAPDLWSEIEQRASVPGLVPGGRWSITPAFAAVAAAAAVLVAVGGVTLLISRDNVPPPSDEPVAPVTTTHVQPVTTTTPSSSTTTSGTKTTVTTLPLASSLGASLLVPATGGGGSNVYLVTPDAVVTKLTDDSGSHAYPSWSPDGSAVLFEARHSGSPHLQLFVINSDGTGLRQLTDDPNRDSFQPQWSPDGSQIVFVQADKAYWSDPQEIWIMDADGSNPRIVSEGDSRGPLWSPDGSSVTFLFSGETYRVSVVGGERVQLTDIGAAPISWSPDGKALAVEGERDAVAGGPHRQATDIWLVPVDGSPPTQLTSEPGRDYLAQWSSDGSQILFTSDRDGDDDLYLINSDGSGLIQLTSQSGIDGAGRWLPDGRIVFLSDREGEFALYVMDADGSDVKRVWPEDADATPVWFAGIDVIGP